jgi:hypothetical protein
MSTLSTTPTSSMASVMDTASPIVLSMIYHRAPLAADAGIPVYSSDPAVLRQALRASPLGTTSSLRPSPYLPMPSRTGSTSSLGTFRSAPGPSSLRSASPSPAPSPRLSSPYARIDRKYAQGEDQPVNAEVNTFPGFDAAMGTYALPENSARRWWRKSGRLGRNVRARAYAHLFLDQPRDD